MPAFPLLLVSVMFLLPLRLQTLLLADQQLQIGTHHSPLHRSKGVEAISCEGQPFDPQLHEAVMREQSSDVPDGTVLRQLRGGYTIGGRLLRPALVAVSCS